MTFNEVLDDCRNADMLADTDTIRLYRASETLASRVDRLLALATTEGHLYLDQIKLILEGR